MAKTKKLEEQAASIKVNVTLKIGKNILRKMRLILAMEKDFAHW